jgi:release factor glutamine methyltransferase
MRIKSTRHLLQDFFKNQQQFLQNQYPGINVNILVQKCFENFGNHYEDIIHFGDTISTYNLQCKIQSFLTHLETGKPIEYFFKEKFFYRSLFYVDENVLIPRNETEILVEKASQHINKYKNDIQHIAEVGVGSGCIFLSLLMESEDSLDVDAYDIDPKALKVCRYNKFLKSNQFDKDHRIKFFENDRLENIEVKYDFIISNPPYIKEVKDREGVHSQVHDSEPHVALYLPDKTYNQWFNDFFKQIYACLKDGAYFMMEGHEDHLEHLAQMLRDEGFSIVIIEQDYTQRDRFITAKK